MKNEDIPKWKKMKRLYATSNYKALRRSYLSENPWCKVCFKSGRHRLAVEIDHVVPVSKRPDLFYDVTNWQAICRECHIEKTRAERENPKRIADRKKWDGTVSFVRELIDGNSRSRGTRTGGG